MSTWLTFAAVVVLAFLVWNLYRRFGTDRIAVINDRRRATSQLVSRGEFVDGNRHLDVALAVTQSTLFYENPDMEASIDLENIHEIEYDTELATGHAIASGAVLRLRAHSQSFEFIVPQDVVSRWTAILPPRRLAEAAI